MVLKVMKEIESVVKFNEKHPYPYWLFNYWYEKNINLDILF